MNRFMPVLPATTKSDRTMRYGRAAKPNAGFVPRGTGTRLACKSVAGKHLCPDAKSENSHAVRTISIRDGVSAGIHAIAPVAWGHAQDRAEQLSRAEKRRTPDEPQS